MKVKIDRGAHRDGGFMAMQCHPRFTSMVDVLVSRFGKTRARQ
jgi:hypothetical protein